jgi:hypothetical protein
MVESAAGLFPVGTAAVAEVLQQRFGALRLILAGVGDGEIPGGFGERGGAAEALGFFQAGDGVGGVALQERADTQIEADLERVGIVARHLLEQTGGSSVVAGAVGVERLIERGDELGAAVAGAATPAEGSDVGDLRFRSFERQCGGQLLGGRRRGFRRGGRFRFGAGTGGQKEQGEEESGSGRRLPEAAAGLVSVVPHERLGRGAARRAHQAG